MALNRHPLVTSTASPRCAGDERDPELEALLNEPVELTLARQFERLLILEDLLDLDGPYYRARWATMAETGDVDTPDVLGALVSALRRNPGDRATLLAIAATALRVL